MWEKKTKIETPSPYSSSFTGSTSFLQIQLLCLLPPPRVVQGDMERVCGQSVTAPLCRSFLCRLFPCSSVGSLWAAVLQEISTCSSVESSMVAVWICAPSWSLSGGSLLRHPEHLLPILLLSAQCWQGCPAPCTPWAQQTPPPLTPLPSQAPLQPSPTQPAVPYPPAFSPHPKGCTLGMLGKWPLGGAMGGVAFLGLRSTSQFHPNLLGCFSCNTPSFLLTVSPGAVKVFQRSVQTKFLWWLPSPLRQGSLAKKQRHRGAPAAGGCHKQKLRALPGSHSMGSPGRDL